MEPGLSETGYPVKSVRLKTYRREEWSGKITKELANISKKVNGEE